MVLVNKSFTQLLIIRGFVVVSDCCSKQISLSLKSYYESENDRRLLCNFGKIEGILLSIDIFMNNYGF